MSQSKQNTISNTLPIILIAAVIQGLGIYGLHYSYRHEYWPATEQAYWFGFCMLTLFVPTSVQLLATHLHTRACQIIITLLAILVFYFGWHHGSVITDDLAALLMSGTSILPLVVWWLLVLPFIQARVIAGQWQVPYQTWFTLAWRNKLMLIEASLFTGLFWLLLTLWQELFHLLNIDFFRTLFSHSLFVSLSTTMVFGLALHLIGSVERFTLVILEQLLNLLKWLSIIAGLILGLFTLALAAQLPGMISSEQHVIGAIWLLWLVAVMVVLINAAYRDGTVHKAFPNWLAFALRCVLPCSLVIALTALYALVVRIHHYGLTVDRVWALVVAVMAFIYAGGYSLAAIKKGPWMQGIARINVFAAITLVILISATLTPLLSPYRLAASSQFEMAQQPVNNHDQDPDPDQYLSDTPFTVLRFNTGVYGIEKLKVLAAMTEGADAERISSAAKAALDQTSRWYSTPPNNDFDALVAQLQLFPAGSTLPDALASQLAQDLRERDEYNQVSADDMLGLFADLNDDGNDEFIWIGRYNGLFYTRSNEQWQLAGDVLFNYNMPSIDLEQLKLDAPEHVSSQPRPWRDLKIGTQVLIMQTRERQTSDAQTP